jgi:hypothetical protein
MTDSTTTNKLSEQAAPILDAIQKLPPTISPDAVKERMEGLLGGEMNWAAGDDTRVARDLGSLASELVRMRRLKRGGLEALPDDISAKLRELLHELEQVGIFLVPVGELEDWLQDQSIAASRTNNKWAWANEAVLAIQRSGPSTGDIWDFMRRVATFLKR